MSDITRREALTRLATAVAVAGTIDRLAARELHAAIRQGGAFTPKGLSAHHFRTLERLTDLIIPVDGPKPGAVAAGVAPWIDSLINGNADLKTQYAAGLAWLDTAMTARHGSDFASATPAQQTELLDVIAYKKNATPDNQPAITFFTLVRRMTVDGFYTNEIGIREIIPQGRPPHDAYVVPQEDIDYVLAHSPFNGTR